MTTTAIVITSADANFFDFVERTILSLREQMPTGQKIALGFLDVGCTRSQLEWLGRHVDFIRTPRRHFDLPGQHPDFLRALLARPFLRDYFPGFDTYCWIDADAWVHDWSGVDLMLRGASRQRLSIVPEIDRGNQRQYGGLPALWTFLRGHYEHTFGPEVARDLQSYPPLNAGVFALHRRAPHWEPWAACLRDALRRSVSLMTDQMALNLVVYRHCFQQTEMLPAWCNWTCHHGLPAWDKQTARLVEPYLPHGPIGILHLTGRDKPATANLRSLDGEMVQVNLRYPAHEVATQALAASAAEHDYISPGLVLIEPASCFPNRVVGKKAQCPWPFLRREVPHRWWVDRRSPLTGFLNPDEAHILYNTALQFAGRRALEIGCWAGWSACHLALAGVQLDVIDPLLAEPVVRSTVIESLTAAGVLTAVNLVPSSSPAAVHELAKRGRKWSLIFIDGNHDHPGPVEDAIACVQYAEPDAAILFHDLAAPAVAEGLRYLVSQGWQTRVYLTMQIMAIAYRGNVSPVRHVPDPTVDWPLPEHLRGFAISESHGTTSPAANGAPTEITGILSKKRSPKEHTALIAHVLLEVHPPPPVTPDREAFVPEGIVGDTGIDLRTGDQLILLSSWREESFQRLFELLRRDPAINTQRAGQGVLHNGYFPTPDAEAYAAMIATRRPARIVEVGAGFSTLIARAACSWAGLGTKITVVDPSPRTEVRAAVDQAILLPIEQVSAEDIPLGPGDFLFIDSSHICRTRGDLPHLFCRILPALPVGVMVHVHDIFLPYNYPNNYDVRMYTEQYLLHCLLSHSRRYRTLFAMHWLSREHGDDVRSVFGPSAGKDPLHYGASYWLEVVG